jgi:hypothetical protein
VRFRRIASLAAILCASSLPGRAAEAARLYDNTGNPANTYYANQGGAEAIDDLHLASEGRLDTLVFEYYDPAPGASISASVIVYANPGGLDLGTSPFAGPFVRNGLPRGRGAVSIALTAGLPAIAHLWVGIQFTSATAGLIINDTPSVGSSHDLYLENGGYYWFGGDPKANFGLRIIGAPVSVSVGDAPAVERMSLAPPDPNPFRDETLLGFTLADRGAVRLEVWDVAGRRVRTLVDGVREAGPQSVRWSGGDDAGRTVGAGVYFVRLQSVSGATARRVVFVP